MTNLINEYYAVECPDYDFEIIIDLQPKEDWYKIYFLRKPGYDGKESIGYSLPPGQWSLIAISDSITEEQAGAIVEHTSNGISYKGYDLFACTNNAKISFQSLLRSKNLLSRYAIIKKL